MEGTAKAVWNGAGGGGRTRSPEPRIGSGRRVPLAAAAVLMTVVMTMTAISIGPGGDQTESEGATYSGEGTMENPWVFGESSELTATLIEGTLTICPKSDWDGGDTEIPDGYAFLWRSTGIAEKVKEIVIKGAIGTIDNSTFRYLPNLETLDMSLSKVVYIFDSAFHDSNDLSRVIFPNDVAESYIGMEVFAYDLVDEQHQVILGTEDSKPGYDPKDIIGYTFELESGQYVRKAKNCTVTFDPEGGVWSDGSAEKLKRSYASGTELDLSIIEPVKESYTLEGWLGSDGVNYNPGDKPRISGNSIFTAVWKKAEIFTVIFDANGGDWTGSKVMECISGTTIDLGTITPPTRESYTFKEWSCNGKAYSATDKVPVLSNLTFMAQWEANVGPEPITPDPVVPIFPIEGQETIEVLVDEDKDFGDGKDVKTILLIAIVAAIIAELAVLSISRRG